MSSYNRCILIGNLTRDPELKYLPSGTSCCNFNIAVNSKFKSGDELKEEVLFMPVVVFGKRADTCAQYLNKGSEALVEGRLVEEKWETDGGEKKSRIKLIASDVRFMSKKQGNASGDTTAPGETTDELQPF